MNEKFIQIKEVADMLGVSKLTLRNWDKDGKLVALRHPINNYRVYRKEDVENIINKIKSGEKPDTPPKKNKSQIYRIKVLHLKD